MRTHRSHSVEFKRQVAREFLGGETLHGLAKRHDISRNLIREASRVFWRLYSLAQAAISKVSMAA